MAAIRDRVQNSLIERLILRYTGPFLSNIELSSNIREGVINIKNLTLKEGQGFFEAVEKLLQQLSVDVWGVGGSTLIWPHGVDVTKATVKHVVVKVPTPNPFNGDMWKIHIDGVDGEVKTLTEARKYELLLKSKAKALEEAEKRIRKARSGDEETESPQASREFEETEAFNILEVNQLDEVSEGGLAKKIDRYFKKHLDISFNNCHVFLRTVEDEETPEALWELHLRRMGMDLGVGEIHLPRFHYKAVSHTACSSQFGRGVPSEVKLFEEKVGLLFEGLNLTSRHSYEAPPCIELNFPERMMKLHVVRKQWPERDTSKPNGWDRIHVELPDEFQVGVHLDHVAIRGSLIRALHQIFDGVAQNVPNWCDWITCPCPGGWNRDGTLVGNKDPEPGLRAEYLHLLARARHGKKVEEKVPWWKFWRQVLPIPGCTSNTCISGDCTNQEWTACDGPTTLRVDTATTLPISEFPEEVSHATPNRTHNSKPGQPGVLLRGVSNSSTASVASIASKDYAGSARSWGTVEEKMHVPRTFTDEIHTPHTKGGADKMMDRMAWFELYQTTEWLAHLRSQVDVHPIMVQEENLPDTMSILEGNTNGVPKTGQPNFEWLVVPWRRYEITLAFGSTFEVNITNNRDKESLEKGRALKIRMAPKMAAVLVRDLPSEWTVSAWIPGLAIEIDRMAFMELSGLEAKLHWGARERQKAATLERLPPEVSSVCVLHKLRINSLPMYISPPVLRRLLPVVTELIPVLQWPELRYWFGEWGYMPRPLAYLIKSICVYKFRLTLSTEPFKGDVEPPPEAELVVTVSSIDLTSGMHPIYVDHNWEAWWALDVHVGATHIITQMDRLQFPFIGTGAVGMKISRENPTTKGGLGAVSTAASMVPDVRERDVRMSQSRSVTSAAHMSFSPTIRDLMKDDNVAMDIKLMITWITLSPDIVVGIAKLIDAYSTHCGTFARPLMDTAVNTLRGLCGVKKGGIPELPRWIWPFAMKIKCSETDPVLIHLKHTLSKVVQVQASFELSLLFQQPEISNTRFIVAKMSPAQVCIECFDEEGSEAWEPVLESWNFELESTLHVPPTPRFELKIRHSGDEEKPLELNIASSLAWVAKTIYFSWFPIVWTLFQNGVGLEGCRKVGHLKRRANLSACNLTGTMIFATLHHLPRSLTDVVLKVQAIFRARRDRRRVRQMQRLLDGDDSPPHRSSRDVLGFGREQDCATWSSAPSATTSNSPDRLGIKSTPTGGLNDDFRMTAMKSAKIGNASMQPKASDLCLISGKLHPLTLNDSQRLWLRALKYIPRELEKASKHASDELMRKKLSRRRSWSSGPRSIYNYVKKSARGSFLGRWIGKEEAQIPMGSRKTMTGTNFANFKKGTREGMSDRKSLEQARLMNVCRHGHTAVVPVSEGSGAACVCEVVSPTANDRLLLIQSPIRIFNYTTHVVVLCFVNGTQQIVVESDYARGCSCGAQVLGDEQPLGGVSLGLPNGDAQQSTSQEGAWRLPPNCFASVPPHLRLSNGSLQFRIKSESCRHWDCDVVAPDPETSQGDLLMYSLPSGNLVRIRFLTHTRFESSLVSLAGQKVTCWDICILPAFSVTSMCPLALEVEIATKHHLASSQSTVLEPGTTQHFYKHADVSLRMRFRGYEKWSTTLHHAQSDVQTTHWRMRSRNSRQKDVHDEHVTMPGRDGVAQSEVVVRRGDVCCISSPVWLCDKSSLGLKCTDKKGQEYPKAGAYYLLPTKGDTSLLMTANTAQELDGSDKEIRCAIPAQYMRNSSSSVILSGNYKSFPLAIKSQQLDIAFREHHADYSPNSRLLTVVPGLMFSTTVPILLKYNSGAPMPVEKDMTTPVWPTVDNAKRAQPLEDMSVQLSIDEGRCEWSQPIKSSGSSTGVFSLAIASQRRVGMSIDELDGLENVSPVPKVSVSSKATSALSAKVSAGHAETSLRTLQLEISAALTGVLSFSVTGDADCLRNVSFSCDLVAAETDYPGNGLLKKEADEGSRTARPFPSQKSWGEGDATVTGTEKTSSTYVPGSSLFGWKGNSQMKGVATPFFSSSIGSNKSAIQWTPLQKLPPYTFNCSRGDSIGFGWFQPFVKGVLTHVINLYFVWTEDSSTICGPCKIDLNTTSMYLLLRPLTLRGSNHTMTTVIRIRQTKARRIIEVEDQKVVHSLHAMDTNWLCSLCGTNIPQNDDHSFDTGHVMCLFCKAVLRRPGSWDGTSDNSQHDFLSETLRAGGNIGIMDTMLSVRRWFRAIVVDCSIKLPSVGISIMSKRTPAKEVLYTAVEGVEVKVTAPEGALATHIYVLKVQGVRCDRLDIISPTGNPALLASTIVGGQGNSRAALDVKVIRPNVCAFGFFFKEIRCSLGQCWEVEVNTGIMNELFGIGDEFTKSLGPINKFLNPVILTEDRQNDQRLSPADVFHRVQQAGQETQKFTAPRAPVPITMDALHVSDINAKLWVKLRLAELAFVPAEIKWILHLMGGLVMPSLNGAKVHIATKTQSPQRGSVLELGRALLKTYRPEILRVSRTLFGATHLGKKATETVDIPSPPSSPEGVPKSPTTKGFVKGSLSGYFASESDEPKTKRKRTRPYAIPDSNSPALTGAPWLRQPRLLLARARVAQYDAFNASVLHCLGEEVMHEVLHIFRLTEDPANVLLLTAESITVCRVSKDMLLHSAQHRHRHKECSANAVQGRWTWDQVVKMTCVEDDLVLRVYDKDVDIVEHRWACDMLKEERSTACGHVARMVRNVV